MDTIDYQTDPSRYRHWKIQYDGDVAYLIMDVDQAGGLGDYELKLNSYDLGVDIELADAIQRLRFEHPEVHAVIVSSLTELTPHPAPGKPRPRLTRPDPSPI